jgi:hypothetical protein
MRIYRYPRFGRLSDFQVLPPSICSPLLPHSSLLSVRFQSQVSPSHFSFHAVAATRQRPCKISGEERPISGPEIANSKHKTKHKISYLPHLFHCRFLLTSPSHLIHFPQIAATHQDHFPSLLLTTTTSTSKPSPLSLSNTSHSLVKPQNTTSHLTIHSLIIPHCSSPPSSLRTCSPFSRPPTLFFQHAKSLNLSAANEPQWRSTWKLQLHYQRHIH